MALRVCIYSK